MLNKIVLNDGSGDEVISEGNLDDESQMTLLIDASNILAGGGKTHIVELLRHMQPEDHGFEKIILFGHRQVLDLIPEQIGLKKKSPKLFKFRYFGRLIWQTFCRKKAPHSIWFVPGGGKAPGKFVTMCQNLLPIDRKERRRYFFSITWIRLVVLGWLHIRAYRKSQGVIFLNHFSYELLDAATKRQIRNKAFIPHGVSQIFNAPPSKPQNNNDFKLIYVSTIDEYKHQWEIARAVKELNNENKIEISIDFIGAANPKSLKRLQPFLSDSIRYRGQIDYQELPRWYDLADVFIFGSTCETFGMVLLEAMRCGLPVLCSNQSSMPETLGDSAIYFNPLDVQNIKEAILKICVNGALRNSLKDKGQHHASQFQWSKTASETFRFLTICSTNS